MRNCKIKHRLVLGVILFLSIISISCNNKKNDFDASGSFEAEETIISAEVSGVIRRFDLEEGQILTQGELIGYIDSTQLYLKKKAVRESNRSTTR